MAGAFAEAYVKITPEMGDFAAAIKRAAGGIRNIEIPIDFKVDISKVRAQMADLSKPIDIAVSPVLDDAKARNALADLRKPVGLSVTPVLDDAKAKNALTDLRKPVDISVSPVLDDAKAKNALADLDKPIDLSVRPVLDDGNVKGALADLERALTVPLHVQLDSKARAELDSLTKTETKIIEVDYVSRGGKDPYSSFTAAGNEAGERAGKNVTAGMGAAIAGGMKGPAALLVGGLGIKAVVDSGGDFQVAMEKIRVQTGASAAEMAKVDALTLQLGKDQKLGAASAGDAAEAIQVLTKGQFSLSESMDIARSALQLSIVSQQDAATSTGQLATAMAQLKIPVKDAAAVVDSLAAADLKGIIGNAQDYATAIQYAGTQWTQSFRDTAPLDRMYDLQTALVTLDNQAGITGSRAGETIRRMMIDMTGPTQKAKSGIADLTEQFKKNGGVLRDGGQIFVDSAGKMRPLTESIDNLGIAFRGLNPQQVMDMLEPVFTTVGKDGVQMLMNGRDSWDDYRAAVMRSGIAQQLADAQATGLKGAFSGLAGALETVAIQTAKAISPLLIPAINGIGTAVSALGVVIPPLVAGLQALFDKLGQTAPVQGFLDILGRIKTAIGSIFDKPTTTGSWVVDQFLAAQTPADNFLLAIQRLRDEFPLLDRAARVVEFFTDWDWKAKLVTGALVSLAAAIVTTTVVVPAFTAAVSGAAALFAVLTSPVTLVVAALGALAVATKIAYDNFQPFHQAVDAVWQAIVKLPGPTGLAVGALVALGVAVTVATGPVGLLVLGFGALATAVGLLAQNQGARDFVAGIASAIGTAVGVIDGFKLQVQGLVGIFGGAFDTIAGLLRGDFSAAWDGVKRQAEGIRDLIVGIAHVGFGPLIGAIKLIAPAWDTVKRAGGDVLDFLKRIAGYTFGALGSAIRAIGGWFLDPKQAVSDFLRMLGSLARVQLGALGSVIRGIASFFRDPMTAVSNFIRMLGSIPRSIAINVVMNIPGVKQITSGIQAAVNYATGTKTYTPTTPVKAGIIPGSYGTASNPVKVSKTAITSAIHPRAEGGPVRAGTPYIVGEEGPELFFPKVSGEIFTNKDSARFLAQAKEKSFDTAGVVAKLLVRTPGGITGSPTERAFSTLSSSLTSITEAFDTVSDTVAGATNSVSDFADKVDSGRDAITDFATDAGTAIDDLAGGIADAEGRIADNSKDAVGRIADNAKEAGGRIADNSKTAADRIIGLFDSADLELEPPLDNITGRIDDFAEKIIGAGGDAESFGTGVEDVVIDYIVPAAEDFVGAIGDNSPLINAIADLDTGLGDLGTAADNAQTDLNAVNSSGVGLAFDTLTNAINLNLLPALDSFVSKLSAFDISSLGGGSGAPIPVSAVDSDGNVVTPTYIVPPPPGSQSNADNIPGSGGNPNNTPGGSGGPISTGVGGAIGLVQNIPGAGGNSNNTPGGSGGPISPTTPLPLVAAIVGGQIAAGINAAIGGIANYIPNAGLLQFRAAGGPVLRGRPYVVGERGPELFVPGELGSIRTNAALMRADLQLSRGSGRRATADRMDEIARLLAEALDRPNVSVNTAAAIPEHQLDLLAEIVVDKVERRWAVGR